MATWQGVSPLFREALQEQLPQKRRSPRSSRRFPLIESAIDQVADAFDWLLKVEIDKALEKGPTPLEAARLKLTKKACESIQLATRALIPFLNGVYQDRLPGLDEMAAVAGVAETMPVIPLEDDPDVLETDPPRLPLPFRRSKRAIAVIADALDWMVKLSIEGTLDEEECTPEEVLQLKRAQKTCEHLQIATQDLVIILTGVDWEGPPYLVGETIPIIPLEEAFDPPEWDDDP